MNRGGKFAFFFYFLRGELKVNFYCMMLEDIDKVSDLGGEANKVSLDRNNSERIRFQLPGSS